MMITLNKIADEVYQNAMSEGVINWCTSRMAVLCRISALWRKLVEADRGLRKCERNKEIDEIIRNIWYQTFVLMRLLGEKDVEAVIRGEPPKTNEIKKTEKRDIVAELSEKARSITLDGAEHYVTYYEVCKMLDISLATLREIVKNGWLAEKKVGTYYCFDSRVITAYNDAGIFEKIQVITHNHMENTGSYTKH